LDKFDAMQMFVRIVEKGSFSATARERGIGQPAVGKQISSLEAELGTELIHRTSRSNHIDRGRPRLLRVCPAHPGGVPLVLLNAVEELQPRSGDLLNCLYGKGQDLVRSGATSWISEPVPISPISPSMRMAGLMPLSTSIAPLVWRIFCSKGNADRSKTTESKPAFAASTAPARLCV